MQDAARARSGSIIGAFVGAVALLALLCATSVDVLSAARAFVGGESLWSKGQKDAVLHLHEYLRARDESAYEAFRSALAVPLGDHQARLELDRPHPDAQVVRLGFQRGGVNDDDIPGMVRLYRNFRSVSFMRDAITTWAEGDEGMLQLMVLGETVRSEALSGRLTQALAEERRVQLRILNERLTTLEQRFSAKLGEASRLTQRILLASTALLAGALAVFGAWFMHRLLTRQARAERGLRQANRRWELAADVGSIGVFDWHAGEDRLVVDARFAALHGLPAEGPLELTRETLIANLHADDRAQAWDPQALREDRVEMRYRVLRPDGSVRHVEVAARAQDRKAHRFGLARDVTDAAEAARLRIDKEAAERVARIRSDLLSRVSHELRTPLNAILGFAQIMQADRVEPLTPAQSQRMRQVVDGGRSLLQLVDDVLDVSAIEQGTLNLTIAPQPLAPLFESCREQIDALRRAHGVSLEAERPHEDMRVLADAPRLRQVLLCLLSNAVKYNHNGGWVGMSSRLDPVDDQRVAIEVRDGGPGLSHAQQAELFQPFNRLGAEYTPVDGHGLGLVVARQLVLRMQGTIEVSSRVGSGTTFTVWLPRAP